MDHRVVEALDEHRRLIDEQGWSVVSVGGAGRRALPFSHTVGLTRLGHPELLVSGRGPAEARCLLGVLGDEVLAGHRFHVGDVLRRGPWPQLRLLRVTSPEALVVAQAVAADDVEIPALQVVWCDDDGRWPWDPDRPTGAVGQQLFARAPKIAVPRQF
ncbi:DUF4262 domain-containing protein [Quadrisphaera granulorum]|uniref:DUF4262 domain-containing protein n=1 Tax=Quadrisphaera granulorum TaxID=317664 RepID=UPI001475665D|nr:DUF4262 domain-containing protein [Quadrisphaera granulorum]